MPFALLLAMTGCQIFDDAKDAYEGLTNPLVAQGLLLGIEAPQSDLVDTSETDLKPGTGLTVFLADAASADDMENAPVEGATVSLRGDKFGSMPADDQGGGTYTIEPTTDIEYVDRAEWTVAMNVGEDASTAYVELPPGADVNIPETMQPGAALPLNVSGQGFNSLLVVVVDVGTGEITFDNKPETITDIYNLTHGSEEVSTLDIPGTAFAQESVYAVGVAGMQHTEGDDLENMNTILSSIMMGKMRVWGVSTIQQPQ